MRDYAVIGESQFRDMYGDMADSVKAMLESAYPDLGETIQEPHLLLRCI